MSFSPVYQEALSPEPEDAMPSVRMKLGSTFDAMQEDKSSNMKVFARVRPMLQKEEDKGYKECVGVVDEQVVRAIVPSTSAKFKNVSQNGQEIFEDFTYSQAFGPETGQFSFFRYTIMDIMQGFIEGQNCLIFSYGITNSGKTFTLQGDDANPGIIPLAMRLFFASIKHQLLEGISVKPDKFADILMLSDKDSSSEVQLKEHLIQLSEQESANKTSSFASQKSFASILCNCFDDDFEFETETTLPPDEMQAAQSALLMKDLSKQSADQQEGLCSIWISFVEIYNEYIYDLLQPNISNRSKLILAEDQNGDVYVKGAREICISSSEEAIKLLNLGRRNLRIAATQLNYQSSRSHCIFTVKVVRLYDEENGRVNRISFCDLAGSERAAKSKTTGVHLKEAGYINTSLLVLGKCLEQLRLNQNLRDKKMIPLRESKLTRLFSGHFLGKGKAVMIANASPCEYTFDETLNVLRFSALCKTLKMNDSYISAASCSLQNITNQWAKSKAHASDVSFDQSTDFDNSLWADIQEKDEMIEKLLDLADSLRNNLEQEKREKAELELTIRKEVCQEYSEYSDQLIENQKRIAAERIESLKTIHEKEINNLKEMYQSRIDELMLQLEEAEAETSNDESSMSINKGNATLNNEDAETSKLLFESPVAVGKSEEKQIETNLLLAFDTPIQPLHIKSEPMNEDIHNQLEEIKLLQADLASATKELNVVKEQLEITSEQLIKAQSDASLAQEECNSFSRKLEEAEKISMEYIKELNELKTDSLRKDEEIEALKKEKKTLEESILFSSEELAVATAEIQQLKKEKDEAEENYAKNSSQLQEKITLAEKHCEDLRLELESSNKSLSERITQISDLESKCTSDNDVKTKLEEENQLLEDKLTILSEQFATTKIDLQCLTEEKIGFEENSKQKLIEGEKHIADAVQEKENALSKFQETSKDLEFANSHCEKLEFECDNLKNHNSKLVEDYKTLEDKLEQLMKSQTDAEDKCKKLELELENAAKMADSNKLANLKHIEDINTLEEKIKLGATQSDIDEADFKYQELNKQLENFVETIKDQESKIEILEKDCAALKSVNAELSTNYDIEKEKYTALLAEYDTNKDVKCQELCNQLEEVNKTVKDQILKINQLEQDCAVLKCENAELSAIYNIEKEKLKVLSEEHDSASNQMQDLQVELSEAMDGVDNLKLEKEIAQEKYSELFPKFKEQSEKISQLESDCAALKSENEQHKETISKLEDSVGSNESSVEAPTTESNLLESPSQELEEQKLKNNNLEEKCSILVSQLEKTVQDLEERNKKVAGLENKLEGLNTQLAQYTQDASALNLKVEELESECSTHKINHADLLEDYISLEEKFGNMKEQLGTTESSDLKSQLDKLQAKHDELKISYDAICKNYETLDTAFAALTDNIGSLRTNYEQLERDKLEEADSYEKSIKELKDEDECSKKEIEELRNKFNEAQTKVEASEKEILQLTKDCSAVKDNYLELESINVALKAELENITAKNVEDIQKYTEKMEELKKTISTHMDQIKKSAETIETLEKFKADVVNYEDEIVHYKEEITNLETELNKAKLLQEQSDELCRALQKCEFHAYNKIKLLQSENLKSIEEITDMKRQIQEKNCSIGELEKALCDRQKQVKEMDAKITKQDQKILQKSDKIEELQQEKKLLSTEIIDIKMDLQQAQTMLKEKEKQKGNNEKGKKKRSLSDVNTDTSENVTKDSSKDTAANKIETKTEEKVEESAALPKRRRVLRTKQVKAAEPADDSFEIKETNDDDYEPSKKVVNRKKKPASKEVEPPKQRTSRRKLQEQENVSPVKKAMNYVGSKIMSVAQSVASPRVTRGRRKLFNADAEAKKPEPKWKI